MKATDGVCLNAASLERVIDYAILDRCIEHEDFPEDYTEEDLQADILHIMLMEEEKQKVGKHA